VGRILAYLEGHGRVESVAAFLARSRRGGVKGKRGRSGAPTPSGSPRGMR
jgi:hypothetical protein